MSMRIQHACYKFSPATISGLISWWTHSLYSHCAIVVRDDAGAIIGVYEAIDSGYVKAASLAENHDAGTLVDLFDYDERFPVDAAAVLAECESMVGMKYDFAGIASFVTGGAIPQSPCRVFCSEANQRASMAGNVPLQNIPAASMHPAHVAMSLALKFTETIKI